MTQELHTLLASTYSLYIKTHNFHWNIEGSEFFELHELFETQYLGLANDIDEIAEFIRILGAKVPAGLHEFAKNTKIADASHELSGLAMVHNLIQDYQIILELIQSSIDALPDNQPGIKQQLSEYYAKHQKTIWMLSTWSKNN